MWPTFFSHAARVLSIGLVGKEAQGIPRPAGGFTDAPGARVRDVCATVAYFSFLDCEETARQLPSFCRTKWSVHSYSPLKSLPM